MAPQSVKGDWRDARMPGRPGHWDLAEILAWVVRRDAAARGAEVSIVNDACFVAVEQLAERFTWPRVEKAVAAYQRDWDATLAECEAEEAPPARRRKPTPRKRAK
jgi:hypothetical protein